MEVVASLSQGRTAAAQCGLFTHKSVPFISEPPCMILVRSIHFTQLKGNSVLPIMSTVVHVSVIGNMTWGLI